MDVLAYLGDLGRDVAEECSRAVFGAGLSDADVVNVSSRVELFDQLAGLSEAISIIRVA